MDFNEIIKEFVPAEKVEELNGKLKEFTIFENKSGNYVKRTDLNGKIQELSNLKGQLDMLNGQIAELETYKGKDKELNEKLAKMKEENEKYQTELTKKMELDKKRFMLREKLITSGAKEKFLEDVERKFKIDELQIENEKIIGFDDRINPVKIEYPEYFGETIYSGTGDPQRGMPPQRTTEIQKLEKELSEANKTGNNVLSVSIIRKIQELKEKNRS